MPHSSAGPSPVRVHALRLLPGEDVKETLAAFVRERGLASAFVVAAVGSLRGATLRYAGREQTTALTGDLEVVALSGTVARGGEAHLHAVVADSDGRVTGGHVATGCIVRTTLELVVGEAPQIAFTRALAPETGYRELSLSGG